MHRTIDLTILNIKLIQPRQYSSKIPTVRLITKKQLGADIAKLLQGNLGFAAIFKSATIGLLICLSGCYATVGHSVLESKRLSPAPQEITAIDVTYVPLSQPINSPGSDKIFSSIERFGFDHFQQALEENISSTFNRYGVAANFVQLPPQTPLANALSAQIRNSHQYLLVLINNQTDLLARGPIIRSLMLRFKVILYDYSGRTVWNGEFNFHLGNDPTTGLAVRESVSPKWIDGIFDMILYRMSLDGVMTPKGISYILQ